MIGTLYVRAEAATSSAAKFAQQYRTIERAYRENRWSLLNGMAAADFRYIGLDGKAKTIADLEREANVFAKRGGSIASALLRLGRMTLRRSEGLVSVRTVLDVRMPRASGSARLIQEDADIDRWRRSGSHWLLARTTVASETVTQFGSGGHTIAGVRLRRPSAPNLWRMYAVIDRAWRRSDWSPVLRFAAPGARFIEVDGSSKTFDQLSAAGNAFLKAGGQVRSAHMRAAHIVRLGDRAYAAVLTTAFGSIPAGAHRLRFAQRAIQQDTWEKRSGRWLYVEGRILRQTITTFASR